eukprot:Awhi_evm1s15215
MYHISKTIAALVLCNILVSHLPVSLAQNFTISSTYSLTTFCPDCERAVRICESIHQEYVPAELSVIKHQKHDDKGNEALGLHNVEKMVKENPIAL